MSEQPLLPSEMLLHESWTRKEEFVVPSISPKLIPALFPQMLPLFLPPTTHARLNTLVLNRLAKAAVQLYDLELIYAPTPLNEAKGTYPKLSGPSGQIEWTPLKEGKWPPAMQRSVRRWRGMKMKDEG